MDYEKLIERLRHDANAYRNGDTLGRAYADQEDVLDKAVDAMTALLAENKRLKSLLSEGGQDLWSKENQRADRLESENEKLRAGLNDLRTQWDMYGGDEGITSTFAELEQARAEITRLKHYEDKRHDCPIVCAKREIIKAHEELEAVQAELEQKSKLIAQQVAELERRDKLLKEQETELDQMKRERDAAIDCIYKIEDALDRGNDNDWAREHISEWESQKED